MSDEKKNTSVKLTNVRVMYAKVIRPGKAYDEGQPDEWSVNMYLTDADAETMKAHGVNPKEDKQGNEYWVAKRSTKTRAGGDAKAPPVVDGAKQPFTDDIGNGSVCNIVVSLFDWTKGKRSGKFVYLNAVQVVNHVPYGNTGVDAFDIVDTTDGVDQF